jgi:hypothetical protein
MLTAEDLLAGGSVTFAVDVPTDVLHAAGDAETNGAAPGTVRLRPLTVNDLQLIARAAQESDVLLATLMVQSALVEPELTVQQVGAMHVGLVQFLLEKVNEISGITATEVTLAGAAEAPLAKAAFVLADEFGWTPQEVGELTLGQVLLHLQMLSERERR